MKEFILVRKDVEERDNILGLTNKNFLTVRWLERVFSLGLNENFYTFARQINEIWKLQANTIRQK